MVWTVLDSYVDIGSPRIKVWGLSNVWNLIFLHPTYIQWM